MTVGETPPKLSLATVTSELPEGIHECTESMWTKPLSCDLNDVPFSCHIIKKIMDTSVSIVSYIYSIYTLFFYLHILIIFYFQTQYASIEEAKKSVKKNYQWGVLYFNKEYTASLKDRFRLDLNNDTIMENSEIKIWMDNSGKNIIIGSLFIFELKPVVAK